MTILVPLLLTIGEQKLLRQRNQGSSGRGAVWVEDSGVGIHKFRHSADFTFVIDAGKNYARQSFSPGVCRFICARIVDGRIRGCQAGIICYHTPSVFAECFVQENVTHTREISILERISKGRFAEMTRVLADEGG
jgi:hypothetical protein